MNSNKSLKKILSLLIVTCIVALVFVALVTAENTANNWTLHDPDAGVEINIRTAGTGNNLVFYATLSVNGETTISITVPGKDFGSGNFKAYLTIGGYTVYIPIQGNAMGKNGNPEIISGIGAGHNWKEQGRKNPTCIEDGYISYTCQNHAETYIDVLPAIGHDLSTVTVDATCVADGSVTISCGRCGYLDVTVLPALGHDLSTVVNEATCITDGSVTISCSRCDYTEVEVLVALGHDFSTLTVDATCVTDGSITTVCGRCGYLDVTVLPALGHDFTFLIKHKDPTCTTKGYDRFECSRCTATHTIDIPATGHAWSETVVAPTCTKQGYTLHICVNNAKHNYKDNYTGALGHDFTVLIKHKDATCETKGYDLLKCSHCKTTKTVTIPATGHAWSEIIVAPTCLTPGYTVHVCANAETHNYTDNPMVALGHKFSILSEYKDATCETSGYTIYKCYRCDETQTTIIPATGHDWGEWMRTKEPTCEQEGQETQTCKNNHDHIQTRPIPKLDCYTIIYAPGDFGTWEATSHTYKHLLYGDATPEFSEDPYTSHVPGWNFIGWNPAINATVSCSVTYIAQWESDLLVVEFQDWNGALLKSEKVPYGNNATAPTNPTRTGYLFTGWDKNFINITTNLIVTAQYTHQTTQINTNPTNTPTPNKPSTSTPSPSTNIPSSSTPTDTDYSDTENSPLTNSPLTKDTEEPLTTWAFANLALSITGIILALLAVIGVMLQKKPETNKTQQNTTKHGNQHKIMWLAVTFALSITGIVIFLLTENIHGSMVMIDNWTIVNAIIFTVEIITITLTFKSKKQ